MSDDDDGRLKDEHAEEIRERRNDDSDTVPHEEVKEQLVSDNCEKSETPVIYECPRCGSDETPQREHFGGPQDGRNKECHCKNCGLSGFIEDFRIDWNYCPLCGDKYRDAEDLGLHLVRDHDANEDTGERSVEELKEQLQENARKIAEGETVTLAEALDKRTENPDELLDADDLNVDTSDVEISFPEDSLEPAAWMAYNNMGGAGLVPYLLKSRAERNTASEDSEVAEEFPKPLYYATASDHHPPADGIIEELNSRIDYRLDTIEFIKEKSKNPSEVTAYQKNVEVLRELQDLREEFTQKGGTAE